MTEFGNGIFLTDEFDFAVGVGGDLKVSQGFDELAKDISLMITEVLTTGSTDRLGDPQQRVTIPSSIRDNGVEGLLLQPGITRDIELLVSNLLASEPRIDTVRSVSATQKPDERSTLAIDADVQAVDEKQRSIIVTIDR